MRKVKIILFLSLIASAVSYQQGYFDRLIKVYILKEKIAENKNNISTAYANEVITVHDATIHVTSIKDDSAVLTLTLKNRSNKTHELVQIETEISKQVSFFEIFTDGKTRELQQVFGIPIEGFNIVKLTPEQHFAKINNIKDHPKTGDSISLKLIFSDKTEKNILATVYSNGS